MERRQSAGGWSFKSVGSGSGGSRRGSIFDLLYLLSRRGSTLGRGHAPSAERGGAEEYGEDEEEAGDETDGLVKSQHDERPDREENRRPLSKEEIIRKIHEKKEAIETLRCQPWNMHRKLRTLRLAQKYLKRQALSVSKSQLYKEAISKKWKKFRRWCANMSVYIVPWEARIKRIESHFGSVVSSYFTFLRWIFWINLIMSLFMTLFIVLPESLADWGASNKRKTHLKPRKELLPDEVAKANRLQLIWEYEGYIRVSPLFYGFYGDFDTIGRLNYQLPLAFFLIYLVVLGYSFFAILRKMAANARLSKMASGKAEQYTFAWKLFTLWDFTIGNPETATNAVASNVNKMKEAITEYKVKQKRKLRWPIIVCRILSNVIIMCLVAGSAFIVYSVVERSKSYGDNASGWEKNEVPIVVSMITLFFPNLFELVGKMEKYHPRTQLRLQLARVLLLYLLNFYTLIFALFTKMKEIADAQQNLTMPSYLMRPGEFYISDIGGGKDTSKELNRLVRSVVLNISQLLAEHRGSSPTSSDVGVAPRRLRSLVAPISIPLLHLLRNYLSNSTLLPLFPATDFDLSTIDPLNFNRTASDDANVNYFYAYYSTAEAQRLTWTTYLPNIGAVGVDKAFAVLQSVPDEEQRRNFPFVEIYPKQQTSSSLKTTDPEQRRTTREIIRGSKRPSSRFLVTTTEALPPEAAGSDGRLFQILITSAVTRNKQPFQTTTEIPPETTTALEDMYFYYTDDWSTLEPELENHEPGLTFSQAEASVGEPESASTVPTGQTTVSPFTTTMRARIAKPKGKLPASRGSSSNKARQMCWETYMGQEICRLITMDFVMTIASIVVIDFLRGLIVRYCNSFCCWNMEVHFPEYGEFKVAENVLHIVNNQGMIWLGLFFSPLLPAVNNVKLILTMYLRSWAVVMCNVPAQQVFRASRSNNFYLILLLLILLLCTLPVGYVIASQRPSKNCGPFTQYGYFYEIITEKIRKNVPIPVYQALGFVASPGIIVPFLVLLTLVIYFLASLVRALMNSNEDLTKQLLTERTEEKRKIYAMAGGMKSDHTTEQAISVIPFLPSTKKVSKSHLPERELARMECWREKPSLEYEQEHASLSAASSLSLESGTGSATGSVSPEQKVTKDLVKLIATIAAPTMFIPSLGSVPEDEQDTMEEGNLPATSTPSSRDGEALAVRNRASMDRLQIEDEEDAGNDNILQDRTRLDVTRLLKSRTPERQRNSNVQSSLEALYCPPVTVIPLLGMPEPDDIPLQESTLEPPPALKLMLSTDPSYYDRVLEYYEQAPKLQRSSLSPSPAVSRSVSPRQRPGIVEPKQTEQRSERSITLNAKGLRVPPVPKPPRSSPLVFENSATKKQGEDVQEKLELLRAMVEQGKNSKSPTPVTYPETASVERERQDLEKRVLRFLEPERSMEREVGVKQQKPASATTMEPLQRLGAWLAEGRGGSLPLIQSEDVPLPEPEALPIQQQVQQRLVEDFPAPLVEHKAELLSLSPEGIDPGGIDSPYRKPVSGSGKSTEKKKRFKITMSPGCSTTDTAAPSDSDSAAMATPERRRRQFVIKQQLLDRRSSRTYPSPPRNEKHSPNRSQDCRQQQLGAAVSNERGFVRKSLSPVPRLIQTTTDTEQANVEQQETAPLSTFDSDSDSNTPPAKSRQPLQ